MHPGARLPLLLTAAAALTMAAVSASAQSSAICGYWRTASGAIVRIAPCGRKLCVEIAELARGNPPLTDMRNPDPSLRGRPLCGLRIGEGFLQTDPQHASGGHLYDPKSGHTYSGRMSADGRLLHLRGYLGVPIFGRSETWSRASRPPPCPTRGGGKSDADSRSRPPVHILGPDRRPPERSGPGGMAVAHLQTGLTAQPQE